MKMLSIHKNIHAALPAYSGRKVERDGETESVVK